MKSDNLVPKVPEESGLGNTKLTPKKQISCAKKWCFTLNNYTEKDITDLKDNFSSNCEKYIFETEKGENETPHLQGYIVFDKKKRPSELKLTKSIHWESCKGSEADNINYCSKDFRDGVFNVKIFHSDNIIIPQPLKLISDLYDYQKQVIEIIKKEPDGRSIYWIYEQIGKAGKSAICKYLVKKHNCLCIQGGKLADIMNIIYNTDMTQIKCVIIDIPRNNLNKVSYSSIECILNGMITNTKYETGCQIFNPPHVICFSNFAPETLKLSKDRWNIFKIRENKKMENITNKFEFELGIEDDGL